MKSNVYAICVNGVTVLLLFILSTTISPAQVTFTQAPENLQLYPRNSANKAKVEITGKLLRKNYTRAILELTEDSKLSSTKTADFAATDSVYFNFSTEISARPTEYGFKVILLDQEGRKETVLERNGVVCGDFILLYGQSNIKALVGIDELVSQTDTRLLRNFDAPNHHKPEIMHWYRADQPYASVGVIGLHLQALILHRYGIPTCVLNGSAGGANLVSLIDPDEAQTNSHYDLLYSRVKKAGALENVKAIIWRQGEAETCNWYPDIRDYPANFKKLYGQLTRDYKGFRFYNIQTGIQYCNQLEEAGELREYMRSTKYLFPAIETTNMHALPLSDDVHYSLEGYKKAAEELLPLLGRDLYDDPDTSEIHPPDIQKIVITPSRDTLILVFEEDQKMVYPEPAEIQGFLWKMEDYLYVNTYTAFNDKIVEKGWADRNRIYLKLRWGIDKGFLTYLPSYSHFNPPVQAIHLQNSRGLRAMAFYKISITNALSPPEIVSGNAVNGQKIILTFRENDHYILERRFHHEETFHYLATLKGNRYEDVYTTPFYGTVEYRLKRIADKTESEYSSPIQITVSEPVLSAQRELNERVYPNPFSTHSPLLLSSARVNTVTAISSTGKEIRLPFEQKTEVKYRLHTEKLPSGHYILRIKTAAEEVTVRAVKL